MSGVRREVVGRRGETQEVSFSLEHTWKVSFHGQNVDSILKWLLFFLMIRCTVYGYLNLC